MKKDAAHDAMNVDRRSDIQHTLRQIAPRYSRSQATSLRGSWLSLLIYATLIVALGGTYVLSKLQFFEAGTTFEAYGERALLCGLLAFALLASEKLIRVSALPADFLPDLEESGLVVEVGLWALQQAVRDYLNWKAQGMTVPRISLNISSLHLQHPDFITTLGQAIRCDEANLMPLDIEISESVVMEDTATVAR